ncbi:UDP-glucose 4-epimerase [Tamaricihabitans halophyticus]|uniref:UDP-glucose 4-epimerase n=1 Tax=Tamaricihabitans halophyticus TaxID=1262583 RepID=A0A4V2SV06_9PSEU|nr:NAD-dependent epimerase/dehydratase family protein [Tamaricihabitans halophyticus]TCP56226.1 UDP-glucose 4-epimerase [Tamaricihabitans halophyticus]
MTTQNSSSITFPPALQDRRVLVTGGAGFVGRSVVAAFRANGIPVTVADLKPFETDDSEIVAIQGDLRDAEVREAAFGDDVAGVVHLAAITSVLKSAEQPQETFSNNVQLTHDLLELARVKGAEKFVLASTNAVVGDVGTGRITVDNSLLPLTPYGGTKAAGEMLLSGYAGAYGMKTCALRFTNIYGPGMGHKDSFVPRMMRAALAGSGVQVYGDGGQRRDLVHIDDVVQGILRAWTQDFTGPAIIGAGHSISVLEMIEAVRTVTGAELPIEHVPAKTGEMPAVIVDISRSKEDLGYQPAVSLVEGLETVWRDFLAAQSERVAG